MKPSLITPKRSKKGKKDRPKRRRKTRTEKKLHTFTVGGVSYLASRYYYAPTTDVIPGNLDMVTVYRKQRDVFETTGYLESVT